MNKRNTDGLNKYAQSKNAETIEKVTVAIDKLKRSRSDNINFSTVAKEAGVSKASLYNNAVLKERILGLRTTAKGVSNTTSIAKSNDRIDDKGYLDEVRKLRNDKKNLVLQLLEMEAIRDENIKLKARLEKREDGYVL